MSNFCIPAIVLGTLLVAQSGDPALAQYSSSPIPDCEKACTDDERMLCRGWIYRSSGDGRAVDAYDIRSLSNQLTPYCMEKFARKDACWSENRAAFQQCLAARGEANRDRFQKRSDEIRSISPGRLTAAQRKCLISSSSTSAGIQDNRDAIETCNISDDLIAPAISMLGGLQARGQLIDTPWSDEYCAPRRAGFECTYRGVTVIFH